MYFLFEHWFTPVQKKLVTIFFIIQFILNGIVLLIMLYKQTI